MTFPSGGIQIIKDIREATGLGLGESKAIYDWMIRSGGGLERMINNVIDDTVRTDGLPAYVYRHVPSPPPIPHYIPPFTAAPNAAASTEDPDLERRVGAIERWIQNQ